MQTTAKWTRKELKQFITVYQWILEFSLEKVWLEVIIKHNKQDPDDMLDDVNAKLIEVCEEYLDTHNIGLDKFQLATVVMDLYTQTISELKEPFSVLILSRASLFCLLASKYSFTKALLSLAITLNGSFNSEMVCV